MQDYYEKYYRWFPELNRVKDQALARAACDAWEESIRMSGWNDLSEVPFHPNPIKGCLLHHLQITTKIAVDMAEAIMDVYAIDVDMDVLILSATMHDLSKPNEFEPRPDGYGKSRLAYLYQHGVLGAHFALNNRFPPEIVSIIISHTRQSNFDVKSLEGRLICEADDIAAATYNDYLSPVHE